MLIFFLGELSAFTPPSFQTVRSSFENSDAVLLDKHGTPLHYLRIDKKRRRLHWIEQEKISVHVKKLLIRSEDKRFYSHSGVDYLALSAGFYSYVSFAKRKRGASTITMQLTALLDKTLAGGRSGRSVRQKWQQILAARQLEERWSKKGILEAYLNLVSYRGELIGIDSAARGLFQKAPHSLNFLESLLLISLIKNPQASIRRISQRGCYLARLNSKKISCKTIRKFFRKTLSKKYHIPSSHHIAFHLAQQLKGKKQRRYQTSLDAEIQQFAIQSLRQHILALKEQNVHDGAILIVDNSSGAVLAYVGSSGELSESWQIDAIHSRRQAGSTLKPFLYALAFEKNLIHSETILDDNPIEIQVGNGIYKPGNYQNSFHGKIPAKIALASSLNVPAVKTLVMLGERNFWLFLKQLGFSLPRDYEYYGLSLALGSADISLWELVNSYRTLANDGYYSQLYFQKGKAPKGKKRLLSAKTAREINAILANRQNRMLTFGLENPLSTRYASAVKTGTSKDMRDNWCVGYTKEFTVGVWVGNSSGTPMWNVSGISGAAPIWIEIMNWLAKNRRSNPIANYYDFHISETKRTTLLPAQKKIQGIQKPTHKSIFAYDPDMPASHQRIFFEAKVYSKKYYWQLNGKKLAVADEVYLWPPKRGRYQLSLVNPKNQIVESVIFEVR